MEKIMIATGVYEPAAPGATHVAAAAPLRDRFGHQVRATVDAASGRLVVWHDRMIKWQGQLPAHLITPADLFRWLQAANR